MKRKNVMLIDHYDSFTYTIKSYFDSLGVKTQVITCDSEAMNDLDAYEPSCLVLSPGPGAPDDAPLTLQVIKKHYQDYPILGICLGHQCIAQAFGGVIKRAEVVMHGKQSIIEHDGSFLFSEIPQCFSATRYHSLIVDEKTLPQDLSITAWTRDASQDRVVMGLAHQVYPTFGIQYHPEAIMTEHGLVLFKNFLSR
ncbi:MAG: anthranilate synthase component II [Legionellaceae bacterium]